MPWPQSMTLCIALAFDPCVPPRAPCAVIFPFTQVSCPLWRARASFVRGARRRKRPIHCCVLPAPITHQHSCKRSQSTELIAVGLGPGSWAQQRLQGCHGCSAGCSDRCAQPGSHSETQSDSHRGIAVQSDPPGLSPRWAWTTLRKALRPSSTLPQLRRGQWCRWPPPTTSGTCKP